MFLKYTNIRNIYFFFRNILENMIWGNFLGWLFSVRFDFYKKKQSNWIFFLKKTETGSNWPISVRFFEQNRFKPVCLGFSVLARFFPVRLGFFGLTRFFSGLGSVLFFQFQAYKTEIEPVGFFKILIGLIVFFHGSVFSVIFFIFSI